MSNSMPGLKPNLKSIPNPKGTQSRPAQPAPSAPRTPNGRFTPPFRPIPTVKSSKL
jgi:hypothetical protein